MFKEIKKIINDNQLISQRRYTLREFYLMDDFLEKTTKEDALGLLEQLDDLKKGRKLFEVLRYLYILIAYQGEKQWQDDFQILVDEFDKNRRYDYLFHFLDKMIQIRTSGFLLKLLLKYQIKAELGEEDLLRTYETLLKLDRHDHELIFKIAEIKKGLKDVQGAVFHYKMALHRCMEIKATELIEKIVDELIFLGEKQRDFYFSFLHNISTFSDVNFVSRLYEKVFLFYFSEKDHHTSLDVLDEMIERELDMQGNLSVQHYLIEVIQNFYKDHENVKNIIEFSRLGKQDLDLKTHYKIFKQMIRYEKGRFVHHPNFGYGVIKEVEQPTSHKLEAVELSKIVIDFESKKAHSMSLRIANKSLKILPRKHLLGAFFFKGESFEAAVVNEAFIDRLLLSLDKDKDMASIRDLITRICGQNSEKIFKKVKDELEKGERYVFRNKQYQISDDYIQSLLEQYRRQKDVLEKLKIAKFIFLNYPKSSIVSYLASDFGGFLKEKTETEVLLYGKFFQNKKVPIDVDLQTEFNLLYKKIDFDLFDRLESPLGKIYMDFIFKKAKGHLSDIRSLFLNSSNEQRFYYFDLLMDKNRPFREKEIIETLELVSQSNSLLGADNYFQIVAHVIKRREFYKELDMHFIYGSLLDKLDEYYKGERVEDRRNYNKIKNLLFDQDFYDFLREKDLTRSLLQRFLQLHYLDDYIKVDLREIEVEIERGSAQ